MTEKAQNLNHLIIEFYEKLSSWEYGVVRGHELSLSQMHVIEILGLHKGTTMKELARKMGVTTGSLTVVVDKLVRKDLVRRRPHDTDRRSLIVELTEKGEKDFLEHDEMHSRLTEEIVHHLSKEEVRQLTTILAKVNEVI